MHCIKYNKTPPKSFNYLKFYRFRHAEIISARFFSKSIGYSMNPLRQIGGHIMSITVCKFGGSSVSDASMFLRVSGIIRSNADRKYIVLSAPGKRNSRDEKITDLFYRAHDAGRCGDYSILSHIFSRYAEIRDALAPDFDLESEFARIRANIHTSADYAASRGEYLCAKLFAAYAGFPFIDAAELIFFDSDGNIDMEKSACAARATLHPPGCAVIPGFYGSMPDGSIKTFSRGGSDVSGALIAAFLNADLYENWTDVDGLYTADPAIVPDAQRSPGVSLAQMERIASAGAKLLHPDSLGVLRGCRIDTLLKNTFLPGNAGTRISEDHIGCVRCVTGRQGLYMLSEAAADCSSGAETLLHSLPMPGSVRVSLVCAFGLSGEQINTIRQTMDPIHIIHMQDHIQIIVPDREYINTIRTVHTILMH